jgi:hypothetical protein
MGWLELLETLPLVQNDLAPALARTLLMMSFLSFVIVIELKEDGGWRTSRTVLDL